ncbi:MAG: peptide deformylase, partial [Proteobacteria bacterium]|nr:peptide deformylase [Pseudomonadota bacterium]
MAIRDILKMGNPDLLKVSEPITDFNDPELFSLIDDMIETMKANDGAGLAAPQIAVFKRLVIFGFDQNDRYPDAEAVPFTVLINPEIKPLSDELENGWEGCLSVPGLRGVVPRFKKIHYQ